MLNALRQDHVELGAQVEAGFARVDEGFVNVRGRLDGLAAVVPTPRRGALTYVRPAQIADEIAELQVRWPGVPIVFCDNRKLAQEWTYRFLAAAAGWAQAEAATVERIGGGLVVVELESDLSAAPAAPDPSTAELRAWARAEGFDVPDRGRLRPEVLAAWRAAQRGP